MNEQEFRHIVADNLIYYRKLYNMTQSELATKLSYSDKSISKWERAEGVPDIFIMRELSNIYGITIDELISPAKRRNAPKITQSKYFVTVLSVALVWLIAVTAYVALEIFCKTEIRSWLSFVYAVPISSIVVLALSPLWGNKIVWCLSTSVLIWSITFSFFMTFVFQNNWLLFLIPIPLQAMTIIWFFFRRILHKK